MQHTTLLYVLDASEQASVSCDVLSVLPRTGKRSYNERYPIQRVKQRDAHQKLGSIDRRILMSLYMAQALNSSEVELRGRQGHVLFRQMVESKRCYWRSIKSSPLRWGKNRSAKLAWRQIDGISSQPLVSTSPTARIILPLSPGIYIEPASAVCGALDLPLPEAVLEAWLTAPPMSVAQARVFWADLARSFPESAIPAPAEVTVVEVHETVPGCHLDFVPVRASTDFSSSPVGEAIAHVEFEYEGARVTPNSERKWIEVFKGGKLQKIFRNQRIEEQALKRLEELVFEQMQMRPNFNSDSSALRWKDAGTFESFARQLRAEGWSLSLERKNRIRLLEEEAWYANLEPSQWNWFEFEAGITIDGRKINLLPVMQGLMQSWRDLSLRQIRNRLFPGPLYIDIGPNEVCALPSQRLWLIVVKLIELFDQAPIARNQRLQLDPFRAAEIIEFESWGSQAWAASPEVRQLAEMLRKGVELRPLDPPAGFKSDLRPYQKMGLAWLQFLREHDMHGILADDMGLGKTVQTLAHLLLEKQKGRLRQPCLIVAPTSLMTNWVEETHRFAPDLSLLLLHGRDRKERFDRLSTADLVLTTYPLLRFDAEQFTKQTFSYLILDEAQAIKNSSSQLTQIVSTLRANRRLCLTGTPMENHLGELWSLFHFLMPGFLGSKATFNSRFRIPIEKLGLSDRQSFLSKRIGPFLLRRTKVQVEKDLPIKTEMVRTIELTEKQRDLYETVRLALDRELRQEVERQGWNQSQIMILDALLKLRQICCDPRLYEKGRSGWQREDSAKLTLLLELLPELIESGRKVLLFSQFTSMLSLIEKELRAIKMPYVILTGSTRDRATPISKFQNGSSPLFLISLKAGGSGLNLTAADSVIHYDPWWNPAVENQATDRAHRIGQSKPVFVYKLLTEGTVEAKIQKMQARKKQLAEGILSGTIKEKLVFRREDLDVLLAKVEDNPANRISFQQNEGETGGLSD